MSSICPTIVSAPKQMFLVELDFYEHFLPGIPVRQTQQGPSFCYVLQGLINVGFPAHFHML